MPNQKSNMPFSKTIFMTGFPGFIAERVVERLADSGTQFLLLAQPQLMERAAQDAAKIAERAGTPKENFVLVEGDITYRDLGMSTENFDRVVKETTDVFHLAAVYDLGVSKELAGRVNVEGTQNVNELVKKIEDLKRYNYISTCYVAGKREGVIGENELEHDAGFRNNYEETKYLAEVEVEKLKNELPVTIFRPSVVCGDSKTGETLKYDGVYYLIKYLRKFPALLSKVNIGNDYVHLNLVPVDFVADGIAALSKDERAVGKTIQLADPAPLTTEEIFNVVAKSMGSGQSIMTLPAKLTEGVLMMPLAPELTGLPNFGVPYFFIKQRYDTASADELLASHGIKCPPFDSYAQNLCDFENKHREL